MDEPHLAQHSTSISVCRQPKFRSQKTRSESLDEEPSTAINVDREADPDQSGVFDELPGSAELLGESDEPVLPASDPSAEPVRPLDIDAGQSQPGFLTDALRRVKKAWDDTDATSHPNEHYKETFVKQSLQNSIAFENKSPL